jgi:hypothetical protein
MTDSDLYELACRAVSTPRADTASSLHVLTDVLLERGLIEAPKKGEPSIAAFEWAERKLRPQFVGEEGTWNVEVSEVLWRQSLRAGLLRVILFRAVDSPWPLSQVIRVAQTGADGEFRPHIGVDREALQIEPGPYRLEVKKLLTRSGKYFFRHTWSKPT